MKSCSHISLLFAIPTSSAWWLSFCCCCKKYILAANLNSNSRLAAQRKFTFFPTSRICEIRVNHAFAWMRYIEKIFEIFFFQYRGINLRHQRLISTANVFVFNAHIFFLLLLPFLSYFFLSSFLTHLSMASNRATTTTACTVCVECWAIVLTCI